MTQVKPTTFQTQILKALITYSDTSILYSEHFTSFVGERHWKARLMAGKPRVKTIKKMIREGWLVLREDTIKVGVVEAKSNKYDISKLGREVFQAR